jgi:two-component system CheB/CheR fusion protein
MRIRPYRTTENKIDGLVVLLVDIDQQHRSQQKILDARDFAASVVESVPFPIVVLNPDCTISKVNTAFRDLAQMQATDLENRSLPDVVNILWGIDDIRDKLESLLNSPPGTSLEFEHESTTARRNTLIIRAHAPATDGNRVLSLMVEDVSERRNLENLVSRQRKGLENEIEVAGRKLNRTQEELRGLTMHLFTAQEDERQHVARELHDDISQRLSVLELLLHEARTSDGRTDGERIEAARAQVQLLNNSVRQISHRLHPAILQDLGLASALKALVQEFGESENMPVTFTTHELPENWSRDAATELYRIAQEALRNISKHSGKTHVKVILSGIDSHLELRVMDFGQGFDQESESPMQGLGMISMQERARLVGGTLEVTSALGQGTTVIATVPLNRHA